jgi:predicted AAA+ superfamily ATPase
MRAVKGPKIYFFDTGLIAYLTKYSSPEILLMNGAINIAILENYVVAEIMKCYSNLDAEPIAHYYRNRDGKEIDLFLEYDCELHPIEVKKSASTLARLTAPSRRLIRQRFRQVPAR